VLACVSPLAACGQDELEPPRVSRPGAAATPVATPEIAPGATPAATLRQFRTLYGQRNPEACKLVTDDFVPSAKDKNLTCEEGVTGGKLDLALVTLSRTGNTVRGNRATQVATLRDPAGETVAGTIELRRENGGWQISEFRR